jgi:hypothetical protein
MLSVFDRRPGHTRREFLRFGSFGLGGLAHLLGNRALAAGDRPIATGKSVVFLYQFGGPSQFETFDPKMGAPEGIRCVNGEVATSIPGITFGSLFPKMASRAHRMTTVRSYVPGREISNHLIYPIVHPTATHGANLGSLYSRMVGMTDPTSGMPTNAALYPRSVDPHCHEVRFDFGNFHATGPVGTGYAPFVPGGDSTLQENMRISIDPGRLDDRRQLLAGLDAINRRIDTSGTLDAIDQTQAQAFDVILRGAADAFDLSKEPARVVARYDTAPLVRPENIAMTYDSSKYYVDHAKTLGKLLLFARRLCERGCGFVMVNTGFVWDMHGVAGVHAGVEEGFRYVAPPMDHAVAAFLDDLEVRGLSDKILLVMCGEMGRTPVISENCGRNHWGNLGPLALAGGGLPMGQVIGRSTANGGEPADNPVTMRNLLGTIFHTLFDVGELRRRPDATGAVARLITESEPIRALTA